ncbi:MAG: hypothetical protein ACRDY6_23525 [Acidimicrobiia bacterium]
MELLLPRTDAGVLAQALVVFPALGIALVLVWRDREWRALVFGLLTMTTAWFGLRAVH